MIKKAKAKAEPKDRRVQLNLRMLESERQQLVDWAKNYRTTLNGAAVSLLMRGIEQDRWLYAEQIVENVLRAFEPLLADAHELNVSGDYRRAVGILQTLVRPLLGTSITGQTSEAITAAMHDIEAADRLVEYELGRRLRQMHTTGARR